MITGDRLRSLESHTAVQQRADVLGPVQQASDEQLLRARTVLLGLRMFYGLHVMHALFMPDTPSLAAQRAKIDELGVFPILDHVIALGPSPRTSRRAWPSASSRSSTGPTRRSWISSRRTRPSSSSPETSAARLASWKRGPASCGSTP